MVHSTQLGVEEPPLTAFLKGGVGKAGILGSCSSHPHTSRESSLLFSLPTPEHRGAVVTPGWGWGVTVLWSQKALAEITALPPFLLVCHYTRHLASLSFSFPI